MEENNDMQDAGPDDFGFSPNVTIASGPGISTLEGVGAALTAAIGVAEEHIRPEIITVKDPLTGTDALVVVKGDGVHALDADVFSDYMDQPKHRQGSATMLDLASLIAHVNRFKDGDSVVFANNDRKNPSLTAVLDYHKAGSTSDPRFGTHRTLHKFPLSDEWKAWNDHNKKAMTMREFAHFLEDRIVEVLPRDYVQLGTEAERFVDTLGGMDSVAQPGRLMDIARNLQVKELSVVREAQTLQSGEVSVEFQTEHQDATGQRLVLPSMFVIGIPVFVNGPPYQLIARFRYRKDGSSLIFYYELWRADRVFDHAFDEALDKVREETGLPVLIGSPE